MSRTRSRRPLLATLAAGGVGAVLLAACTGGVYDTTTVPGPTTTTSTSSAGGASAPSTTTTAQECLDDGSQLASYAPSSEITGYVQKIKKNGRLVAGVSADTLLLGSRNPITGRIEGFDIDQLHAIAKAIFGDPDKIEFRVITTAQRIPVLQDDEVDVVARTMTINCERWKEAAFSRVYYQAGQKVLVRSDSAATSIDDLDGERVCAPRGSTSLTQMTEENPDVVPVPADTHTGCLVLFQQGEVAAITGDDTVLAGLAAQDPYAKVVGDAFSEEPYGLAVSLEHPELVRFVNHVLDQEIGDGGWAASYDLWLRDTLGAPPALPKPDYGRKP